LFIEVFDSDRLSGQKRSSGRRTQVRWQDSGANDALLPSKTRHDEEIGCPRTIPKNLNVVDLHCPGDLNDGLIEESIQIDVFTCESTNVD
jgi:hypothetical protein